MTEPRVILKVGKQLSLVFFPEKKRLCIFVQWESANNVQKVSASSHTTRGRGLPSAAGQEATCRCPSFVKNPSTSIGSGFA
jgi:hypothetical protein